MMEPEDTFEKAQERSWVQVFIGFWIFMLVLMLIQGIRDERRIMKIHYCHQEKMDGTLYHYECPE